MQNTRMARLAGQLQQEIATIIQRELKHPGLGFVTITRVELSKDVRHAKVFYSCLGKQEERKRSQEALDRSSGYIHGLIKKRFRLKIIPAFTFLYDPSIEGSIELSAVFERLKEGQQDLPPDEESPPGA